MPRTESLILLRGLAIERLVWSYLLIYFISQGSRQRIVEKKLKSERERRANEVSLGINFQKSSWEIHFSDVQVIFSFFLFRRNDIPLILKLFQFFFTFFLGVNLRYAQLLIYSVRTLYSDEFSSSMPHIQPLLFRFLLSFPFFCSHFLHAKMRIPTSIVFILEGKEKKRIFSHVLLFSLFPFSLFFLQFHLFPANFKGAFLIRSYSNTWPTLSHLSRSLDCNLFKLVPCLVDIQTPKKAQRGSRFGLARGDRISFRCLNRSQFPFSETGKIASVFWEP